MPSEISERDSSVGADRCSNLRVSVVIPCFRDAATLGRALNSVRAQTRAVNEIVIVNDCSPESGEIEKVLARYPEVVYVKNTSNLGLAASRNVGLSTASGDVVAFLDADDEYHPQKIAIQLSVLTPDAVVTCSARRFSDHIPHEMLCRYEAPIPIRSVSHVGKQLMRNTLTGAALMAYRDLLLRFGGYDETLRSCEDFDLWLRLLHANVMVKDIQLPLYHYYLNDNSLSRNWMSISMWELEVLKRHEIRTGHLRPVENCYWATIWTWWFLKQLLRAETVSSRQLTDQVLEAARLVESWPVHRNLIRFVGRARLFRLIAR